MYLKNPLVKFFLILSTTIISVFIKSLIVTQPTVNTVASNLQTTSISLAWTAITSRLDVLIPAGIGVTFLLLCILLAIIFPQATTFQVFVFRTVLALAAAGFAAAIPGLLDVSVQLPGLTIRAVGALAAFVLVYLFNPRQLLDHEQVTNESSLDSAVVISSLRVKDRGPGLGLLDIMLQNKGGVDAIVHGGKLIVQDVKPVALGAHPRYFPSTHQYNVIIPASVGQFPIELSQVVPARSVDRFQVIFALGHEKVKQSPWGSAGIEWIQGSDNTKLTCMKAKCALHLLLDEDKTIQTEPFDFTIRAPGFGFKAKKIAGATLEEKLQMLGEQDVNVLESVVLNLATIGGDRVHDALRELNGKDLTYLKSYYEQEIYNKVEAPGGRTGELAAMYWDLPKPEQRLDSFKVVLQRTLQNLDEE